MIAEETPNARFLDATQQTIAWFFRRHQENALDLAPPYQRNPVWTVQQKAFLIDSILEGYPIPEIYLQNDVADNGLETYTVVDGQQRLRACIEFLQDQFPIEVRDEGWVNFSELPTALRQRIFKYKFVVRMLPQLQDAEIRDIFMRINRNNVVLNEQELRNATYWGEFIKTMQELSDLQFWSESGLFTMNDIRRMKDVEFISELAVAVLYGPQNKRGKLDQYYYQFESDFPDRERILRTFKRVTTQIEELDLPRRGVRWLRKVDFYTLFQVLADREDSLPFGAEKAGEVRASLLEFSNHISEIQRDPEEAAVTLSNIPAAWTYARSVRNSSDLSSRERRRRSLASFLFAEPLVVEDTEDDLQELIAEFSQNPSASDSAS